MRLNIIGMLLLFTIFATSCGSDDSVTDPPTESYESSISISGNSFDAETNAISTTTSLLITIGTTDGGNRSILIESNEGVS